MVGLLLKFNSFAWTTEKLFSKGPSASHETLIHVDFDCELELHPNSEFWILLTVNRPSSSSPTDYVLFHSTFPLYNAYTISNLMNITLGSGI